MVMGIKTATDAIRLSYGPKGINAVVEAEFYPFHSVANDAQTIIQAVQVTDPIQKRGLGFLKELMDKQEKDSGDGRKTTCIIAEEIITQGLKSELSGVELKRELDALIPVIEAQLDDKKETITEKEVHTVATIAGESKGIGEVLGTIYTRIGRDGIIHIESSGTYTTGVEYIDGIRFTETGFLSPYMEHGPEKGKAIYENPTILVTKKKIAHLNDINPLLTTLEKQGKKDLVIFTDDMDSGVAAMLVKAHVNKVFNICIIKAPVLWKNYIFEDFAKVTDATIVEDASGITLKSLPLSALGTCDKIVVDKNEVTIIGSIDITDHLNDLKLDGSDDAKLRLSWLTTKTAILRLGANSESELSYIRLKCMDAINASKLALQDGVVKGGGIALYNAAMSLDGTTEAGKIMYLALRAPYEQNCINMGIPASGTDFGENVIDAAKVIKNAVRNAVSLASTVLTTGIVITTPPMTEQELAMLQIQAKNPFR